MQSVTEKWCPKCESFKSLDDFHKNARKKDGLEYMCKACNSKRVSLQQKKTYTAEIGRNLNLKRMYGISHKDYLELFERQGGVCAACGQAETAINYRTKQVQNLHVDHCHKTGRVRALLCQDCNIAYGQLREDPERIRKLLRYAESQGENL